MFHTGSCWHVPVMRGSKMNEIDAIVARESSLMRKRAEEAKARRVDASRTWNGHVGLLQPRQRGKEREDRTRWNVETRVLPQARLTREWTPAKSDVATGASKGRKLVNAQQTREPGTLHRLLSPPPIRPSWFVVSLRGEARLVHEYGDVYEAGGRFCLYSLSLIEPSANFTTADGVSRWNAGYDNGIEES